MKCSDPRLGLARRLLAFSVAFAIVLSSHVFAFASPVKSPAKTLPPNGGQTDSTKPKLQVTSASATATKDGVLLHWSTNSVADNAGFNLYRVTGGQRIRVNREIIPGSIFAPGTPAMVSGRSYSWFDRGGSAAATYYVESVDVDGVARMHQAITPVAGKTFAAYEQAPAPLNGADANAAAGTNSFEKSYPAAEPQQQDLGGGSLQQQWDIAAQTALKIAIRKDGWYRVTQAQMVAAGFNPTVDISNLRLFVDGTEIAIDTNQSIGQFGSGDYIEFYGRGLDLPTTDTRIYYLIAGATRGKRVGGEIHLDGDPVLPPVPVLTPPPVSPSPAAAATPVLRDPIFYSANISWISSLNPKDLPAASRSSGPEVTSAANPVLLDPKRDEPMLDYPPQPSTTERQPKAVRARSRNKSVALANAALAVFGSAAKAGAGTQSVTSKAITQSSKAPASKKRRGSKRRRSLRTEHNHVLLSDGFAVTNFDSTFQIKDRGVYYSNLINGDDENYFGAVISSAPVNLTLTTPNPDAAAVGTATLEFALQGVLNLQTGANHEVSVSLNGVTLGSTGVFLALEHAVRTFSIPVAQLQNGNNTLTFTKISTGELCLVDYVRLTYPHAFKADSGSLKFSLRGSQTRTVDGFAVPLIRLIDYTDPLNVSISKPSAEPSGAGYAITAPTTESRSKAQRLLYALPEGQFDQPASLSLNQPSTLHTGNLSATVPNGADFLIIAHQSLLSSMTPLLNLRQSQGKVAAAVDVEDVFDEFSYGTHGPQAIRDFLSYAATNWATKPHYIIFAGDSSFDPRNYEGFGYFDLVPTKLVDATYNETASDDWLADFDDDGIADIPVGRLPARTAAEADLMISKIVNYSPAPLPQSALLVADDPGSSFDFEQGNDNVQALLPAAMPVQRVNVRVEGSSQSTADIIAGINQGRAIVNYSGHGTTDSWASSVIFTAPQATGLTNGMSKLTFVVVMDCLNGYFQAPGVLSLSEAFLKAPNGGAVAAFASSGLTTTPGQRQMELALYAQLYGGQSIPLGDAIKIAKGASTDIDVKRTWIFFGDPSLKIR